MERTADGGKKGGPRLVWLVQTLADVPPGDDWLSDFERDVQSGFRFPKRRHDWRVGRWTAKRTLRSCLGLDLEFRSLEIRTAPDGSPLAYLGDSPAGASVSISHSGEAGLCFAGPPSLRLGCDLETIECRSMDFILDFFCREEVDWLDRQTLDERSVLANLIWSAKESALKALREGLRRDTRSVRVLPGISEVLSGWRRLTVRCKETGLLFSGWWRVDSGRVITAVADTTTSAPTALS